MKNSADTPRRRHDDHYPHEQNGITKWLRIEVLVFAIQTILLVSGLVYSYTKLESKVNDIGVRLNGHVDTHGMFLLRETWSERNKFIDQKLDNIDRKLDLIISDAKIEAKRLR